MKEQTSIFISLVSGNCLLISLWLIWILSNQEHLTIKSIVLMIVMYAIVAASGSMLLLQAKQKIKAFSKSIL